MTRKYMAKDDGAKQQKSGAGCLCWNCARLGSCPRASFRIEGCSLFVSSVIRIQDIAKAFGVSFRTIERYIQKRGVEWLISEAKKKGLTLVRAREKTARWCVKLPYEGNKDENDAARSSEGKQ